ncbi:MAG: hypothetical protein IJU54_02580 [Alphaproteobacteria bacterium]|nr:hypothetical protein [Alphaproteobacteria bacterium]
MNRIIKSLILPVLVLVVNVNNCYSSDIKNSYSTNIDEYRKKMYYGSITSPVAWVGFDSMHNDKNITDYILKYCDSNNQEFLKLATLNFFTTCNRISYALFGTQIYYKKGTYDEQYNKNALIDSYNDVSYLYRAFELTGLEETNDLKTMYKFNDLLHNYNIHIPSNCIKAINSSVKQIKVNTNIDFKLFDKEEDIHIVPFSFYLGNRILDLSHDAFDTICETIETSKELKKSTSSTANEIIINTIKPFYDNLKSISNSLYAMKQQFQFYNINDNEKHSILKQLDSTFDYISDVLNKSSIPNIYNNINNK